MDATHLHLILTHFPIVGTVIGIGILAYGQFSKNDEIKKVALVTVVQIAKNGQGEPPAPDKSEHSNNNCESF